MSNARNLARVLADSSGAISTSNLSNAPNPILPGTVAYLSMSTAPSGWLKANGAAVSRTAYASLFSAIGTSYGAGDGSTTFNIPDLRGYFPRGLDDGRGVDLGRTIGSSQTDQLQGFAVRPENGWSNYWASGGSAGGMWPGTGGWGSLDVSPVVPAVVSDGTNGSPRMGGETRPKNIALLACIKY